MNLKEGIITFETGYHAKYGETEAFESNGYTYWDKTIDESDCKNHKIYTVCEGIILKTSEKLASNETKTTLIVSDTNEDRDFLLQSDGMAHV